MKKPNDRINILKETIVLLIAIIMVLSSAAAHTIYHEEQLKMIEKETPSFVKGSLIGNLNGIDINASFNLNVYPDDGVCVGNISPIPSNIGYDLEGFSSLITFSCFSFALDHDGCINGFNLTGGNFIEHVDVMYDTGEIVNLYHECSYSGGDTMWVDSHIQGNISEINPDSDIIIEDLNEDLVEKNALTIKGEASGRIFYVDSKIHYYDWFYTYQYDGNKKIPFPQTLFTIVHSYYYDSDTESLHMESENHFYPSEQKPYKPRIEGNIKGNIKTEYIYKFVTTDPNEDNLEYFIDWGDGLYEKWIGPYESGLTAELKHTWHEKGTYLIKVKARNTRNLQSEWELLTITIPKSKALIFNYPLFAKLFDRYPNSITILRYLLKL